ncbi:MAG: prepilin-type N-terminal cleavage/methylation domain-containing protein [Desulfamplus sp.]|nr:prepilin-type N-terminal cleavage/methylation domain-containing protein [Desulfamplus sp.]
MKKYIYRSIGNNGVTLVELLVAMAVFSIVVGGIVASRNTQQNQSMTQQQAVEVQQNVRAALSMLADEIRMAGYDPDGSEPDATIQNAGDGTAVGKEFTFAYVNDDDSGNLKTVSYWLDGTDLKVNDGGTTDKLIAENISALTFTYLKSDNTAATAADFSDIRAVTISITATTPANELDRTKGNNTRNLTATVQCRNLGLNK